MGVPVTRTHVPGEGWYVFAPIKLTPAQRDIVLERAVKFYRDLVWDLKRVAGPDSESVAAVSEWLGDLQNGKVKWSLPGKEAILNGLADLPEGEVTS